jgi:hypothetical protein
VNAAVASIRPVSDTALSAWAMAESAIDERTPLNPNAGVNSIEGRGRPVQFVFSVFVWQANRAESPRLLPLML